MFTAHPRATSTTYKTARDRFVVREIVVDGQPMVEIVDPVLNIRASTTPEHRALLGLAFRGVWEDQVAQRRQAH